jgi:phytoene dehydrogenase-like protein
MDKPLEVVVTGAGIAGFSAAAAAAHAGRNTVVFEQHFQPGGYWSSFDITPHWTTDPARVNALLAVHGVGPLEFERHVHVGRYLDPEPGWPTPGTMACRSWPRPPSNTSGTGARGPGWSGERLTAS